MRVSKGYYLISIEVNNIDDGTKNPRQLNLLLFNLIYYLIFTFDLVLFSLSDYYYSLKFKSLSDNFRKWILFKHLKKRVDADAINI